MRLVLEVIQVLAPYKLDGMDHRICGGISRAAIVSWYLKDST